MKKWILFVFALVCVLALVGCAGITVTMEETPPKEEAPVPASPTELSEPPELVVSTLYSGDSVTLTSGNFDWTELMPDGTAGSVIACGLHPLDEREEWDTLYTAFSAGSIPFPEEEEFMSSLLSLYFLDFGEIPPETVTAQRWPAEYIGQAVEYGGDSEEVTVDRSDSGITLIPMGDGEFVYAVRADWGEAGSAEYVFRTIPQVRGE